MRACVRVTYCVRVCVCHIASQAAVLRAVVPPTTSPERMLLRTRTRTEKEDFLSRKLRQADQKTEKIGLCTEKA